jgi:C-terminal processing protease CtpA/Prc
MHMKKLLFLVCVVAVCSGCPSAEKGLGGIAGVNKSVYDLMAENYLWSSSLPSFETSGSDTPTQDYFDYNLRYRVNKSVPYGYDTYGDRFSYITPLGPTTRAGGVEMTYDSGFFPVYAPDPAGGIFLQVCYVTPGSPADGKLERGDAFRRINGTRVTESNIIQLLTAPQMSIEVLDAQGNYDRTENITVAGHYEQPIIADIIYDNLPEKTAYLAYTDFVTGNGAGASGAADELRKAFGRYKSAGVRNLILDLRYNGGGELTAAQILASLISRNSDLGKKFMYMRDNTGSDQAVYLLNNSQITENANIQKLVVLTSNSTASASELIIHCLKPFFGSDIRTVGRTTTGKNVGSQAYVNQKLGWMISPIMFMVYDINKTSGYEQGINPDYQLLEFGHYPASTNKFFDMGTLGNYENEHQLNYAMNILFPNDVPLTPFKEYSPGSSRSTNTPEPTTIIPNRGLTLEPVFL